MKITKLDIIWMVTLSLIFIYAIYLLASTKHDKPGDITLNNPQIIVMDRPLSEMPDEYLEENIKRLYESISTKPHTIDQIDITSSLITVFQNELILRRLSTK